MLVKPRSCGMLLRLQCLDPPLFLSQHRAKLAGLLGTRISGASRACLFFRLGRFLGWVRSRGSIRCGSSANRQHPVWQPRRASPKDAFAKSHPANRRDFFNRYRRYHSLTLARPHQRTFFAAEIKSFPELPATDRKLDVYRKSHPHARKVG